MDGRMETQRTGRPLVHLAQVVTATQMLRNTESVQVWTQRGLGVRAQGLGPGSLLASPPRWHRPRTAVTVP